MPATARALTVIPRLTQSRSLSVASDTLEWRASATMHQTQRTLVSATNRSSDACECARPTLKAIYLCWRNTRRGSPTQRIAPSAGNAALRYWANVLLLLPAKES